eukprot:6163690-Pleurochrysis_carterae.AAC.1
MSVDPCEHQLSLVLSVGTLPSFRIGAGISRHSCEGRTDDLLEAAAVLHHIMCAARHCAACACSGRHDRFDGRAAGVCASTEELQKGLLSLVPGDDGAPCANKRPRARARAGAAKRGGSVLLACEPSIALRQHPNFACSSYTTHSNRPNLATLDERIIIPSIDESACPRWTNLPALDGRIFLPSMG